MKRKNIKASIFYFIGNIFDKAIAFITIPIFTRLLSTADYGVVTTYLSWVSVMSVVITLSLGESVRVGITDFRNDKDAYMSSILGLGTISAVVITSLLLLIGSVFEIGISFQLVILCCLHSYAVSIINAIQWQYVMNMNYVKRTLIQSLPNLIIVFLSIAMISWMKVDKYMGRIMPNALILFCLSIIYFLLYWIKGKKIFEKDYWLYALKFSLPVIFHTISTVVLAQSDRSMIMMLRNSEEAGIYGLAYQFGSLPLVIITTSENIWIPWFTKTMKIGKEIMVKEMVKHYTVIISLICSGIMLVSPEIMRIMVTVGYYGAINLVGPIVVGIFFLFLATVVVDVEYYEKKTKKVAVNSGIVAIVNIILNFVFIPIFGAIAATFTTLFSYLLLFILHYLSVRKLRKDLFVIGSFALSIMIVFISMFVTELFNNIWLPRWGCALLELSVLLVYGYYFMKKRGA